MRDPIIIPPSQILPDTRVYDYDAHFASVKALWEEYPLRTAQATEKHLVHLLRAVRSRLRRPIDEDALIALGSDISAIFYADRIYFEEFPSYLATFELKQLQHDLSSERIDAATEAITAFCVGLLNEFAPDSAFENPEATGAIRVPLIEIARAPKDLLGGIYAFFINKKMPGTDRQLFSNTWSTLYNNLCFASGYPPNDPPAKPKFIFPPDSDLAPTDLVQAYLRDTGLEDYLLRPVSFTIPDETRYGGDWIVAPPGRGKTTLLHSMVMEDLKKDASVILMDSKGDLIDPIKNLAAIKDRLLLIEPNPDFAFALNPLDVGGANPMHAVTLIEYIMAGLLDAKFTALQSTLFRNVVPAIIEGIPNPTLDTFKQVMVKGLPPTALANLNPHAQEFFTNRDTGFNSKTYESTRKEVVWRLDYLLTNPVLRSMFSAAQTKLDMSREMDAGKVIVINNSKSILGDEGAEFFGRFFIALILRAAQQRAGKPPSSKKPCYVYIDECQTVISKDPKVPTLLDECRSQRIALILAHQRTAQLTGPVLDAVANCAIRMANSDDEAKYLAPKLRMDTDELQSLPRGTFGTFVRDLTPRGIQLKVSKVDLDSLPKITEAEMQGIRGQMREQFAETQKPPEAERPPREERSRPATPAPTSMAQPPEPRPAAPGASRTATAPAEPEQEPTDPGEPSSKW
jgi:hypothetical protein